MKISVLTILLIFMVAASFCQMMPVTTTMQTPYGKVPYTYYVPSPQYFYGQANISLKYKFTVVLADDSTFTARTKIDFTSDTHSLTVRGANRQKQKIYPFYTKEIFRIDENGRKISGVPSDSCWLFKCHEGKINAYSFLAEKGMAYVIAIQQGDDGPIVPLTKNNLLPMVGNDPKIVKLVEKGKLVRAVQTVNER